MKGDFIMQKNFVFDSIITILKYIFAGCIYFGLISLFIQDIINYAGITISVILNSL